MGPPLRAQPCGERKTHQPFFSPQGASAKENHGDCTSDLACSLAHSVTHSLTHSLCHSLTHSLAHLLTPSPLKNPSLIFLAVREQLQK